MAFVYNHVFCDESGKSDHDPVIAFSAVCSTSDRLSAFDREWRVLLRSYDLDALHMERDSRLAENSGYRFKRGDTIEERTEALYPFADCINKYLEVGIIQAWDVRGFNHLPHEVLKALGGSTNPYFMAMSRGLSYVAERAGEDERINFIFDDDPYTAWDSYNHYRSLAKADVRLARSAISLSFANDKHFPALQATDMIGIFGTP